MLYNPITILKSVFIFALFLFSMPGAALGNPPEQINQLESQILDTNKKIATLELQQHKNIIMISSLQTSLNRAHQEINDLNQNHEFKTSLSDAANAGVHRTANGHGRGGQ
jgi:hypothetical protein